MSATLTVLDKTTFAFGGEEEFNARRPRLFRDLLQPTDVEKTVDGFRSAA